MVHRLPVVGSILQELRARRELRGRVEALNHFGFVRANRAAVTTNPPRRWLAGRSVGRERGTAMACAFERYRSGTWAADGRRMSPPCPPPFGTGRPAIRFKHHGQLMTLEGAPLKIGTDPQPAQMVVLV